MTDYRRKRMWAVLTIASITYLIVLVLDVPPGYPLRLMVSGALGALIAYPAVTLWQNGRVHR